MRDVRDGTRPRRFSHAVFWYLIAPPAPLFLTYLPLTRAIDRVLAPGAARSAEASTEWMHAGAEVTSLVGWAYLAATIILYLVLAAPFYRLLKLEEEPSYGRKDL